MTESFGGRMQPCHEPHLPRIGTSLATRPFDPAGRTVAPGRVAALTAYVVLLGVWIDVLGVPNDTLQVFVWLWIGTMAWRIHAPWRSHLDFLRDWWMPVLGLVVYFYSRGLTDELGLSVQVQMPITLDRWLGAGVTPTERLQAAWCGNPCVKGSEPRLFDVYFTTVYATHFLAGLTIAAVLWMRSRVEWQRWMRRYLSINFGALVVYIAYPMAPPWMASQMDELGPVSRITSRGWSEIGLDRIDLILQGVGNPVAAMPSLHAGTSFLIAMYGVQRLHSSVAVAARPLPRVHVDGTRLLRRALRRRHPRRRPARLARPGRCLALGTTPEQRGPRPAADHGRDGAGRSTTPDLGVESGRDP